MIKYAEMSSLYLNDLYMIDMEVLKPWSLEMQNRSFNWYG